MSARTSFETTVGCILLPLVLSVLSIRSVVCIRHSYLLFGDDPLSCAFCGLPLTVKQIHLECTHLRDTREKFFTFSFVKELFESVDSHTIIAYQRNIFYHQL